MSTRGNKNESRGGNGQTVRATNLTNTPLAQDISQENEERILLAEEENHGRIDEKGAHSIPIFEQSKWPKWRKTCLTDWHEASGKVLAKCKFCSSGIYHSGNKDSYSNFLRHIKRNHVEEYGKIPKSYPKSSLRQSSMTTFVCNGKKTSKAKK
ncbi:Uncharacterized protein APZ42_005272 [Daphnia magna]|uniref:BED-type domain-containing protein n=1 Tax=Daphnia magna TaxID=35525 RepID=A0A162BYP8_9CRUS|nr:Uncharacterized protein APZ42_005272 [Daphnia magna]